MKKILLLILLAFVAISVHAQIVFEKGYYINNAGQSVNCLIKNMGWKTNPEEFKYKLSENSNIKTASIDSIMEFGIGNVTKYVRSKVEIDRSSELISHLSLDKNPIFEEDTLFLKVLVEGKANLYFYEERNLSRYFYNIDNSSIEQLVYKSYKTPDGKVGQNNEYRLQLWKDLKCPKFEFAEFNVLRFYKKELARLFEDYNECHGHESVNFAEKQKRNFFNLNIRPGLNFSSLSTYNSISTIRNLDNHRSQGFRYGLEAEFILPFNRNKWGLLIEPTYQHIKSEQELASRKAMIEYKSIELPLGVRHYFFLGKNSKIFINGSFVFDFSNDSSIEYKPGSDLEIETLSNLAFGLGFKYIDRLSMELRHFTNREILSTYPLWHSDYNTLSIILGYSLF